MRKGRAVCQRCLVRSGLWLALLVAGPSAIQAQVTTGFVPVDGGRLFYEDTGDGPAVILIHGGFLDHRMWDGQVPVLAPGHRVIRYDVRFHGQSTGDTVPFSDIEDLAGLMDALGVEEAAIVGLSMGGQIAMDFALEHPARASSLVLVGPGLSGFAFDSPEIVAYAEELTAAARRDDFEAMIEVFTRYWCDGPYRTPDEVDPAVRGKILEMLAGSRERWMQNRFIQGANSPGADRVSAIDVPTLVVLGLADMPDIHEVVAHLMNGMPAAERVDIAGVAHMVNMEAAARFNEVLVEFLGRREVGGRRDPGRSPLQRP